MSRWPAFARCKRRLAAGVGPAAAAAIQSRLRTHTLTVACGLEAEGLIELRVAMSGGGTAPAPGHGARRVQNQGEGRLGLRMRRQLLKARHPQQTRPLLIIGTDLPNLHRLDLLRAIEALKESPLVLGPAQDGGYWLLGLGANLAKTCPAWLFSGLPWGSDQVLALTESRALAHGITPKLLSCHNDIDRLEDLDPWLG